MSLTTEPYLLLPAYPNDVSGAPSYSSTQVMIAASTNEVSIIFDAPKTGNVTKVHWRTATVSSGSTVLDCRLETRATTGLASGSLVGTNTNGASPTIEATSDNIWVTITLTAAAALTQGTAYAFRLDVTSGSPAALGIGMVVDAGMLGMAYAIEDSTHVTSVGPVLVLEYDDGTVCCPPGCYPYATMPSYTFNSSSTPDVRGNKFTLAAPHKAVGAWVWVDGDGEYVIELINSDGVTVLATATLADANYPPATGAFVIVKLFSSTVDLSAGVAYRLVVRPTSATSLTIYSATAATDALLQAFPWPAAMTTAKDPTGTGSWTDSTAESVFMGLVLAGSDTGGGSGGSMGIAQGLHGIESGIAA